MVEEEAPAKVEEAKSSPETKDSEIKKAPEPEAEEAENEANGLDFDEMEWSISQQINTVIIAWGAMIIIYKFNQWSTFKP